MTGRWIAFGVACLVVAAAAFGAGAGTVALFSDSETISGSFSVADEQDGPFGPWSENGPANDSQGDVGDGSDIGTPGNGTAPPNGTAGGNDTAGGNGTSSNGTAGGNDTAGGGNGTAGDGGNDTAGGNATDSDAGGTGVTVTSAELAASDVVVGEDGGVVLAVKNDGNVSASFTATLTVEGSETTSETIDLAPDEQSTLSLSHTFQSAGNYSLRAAGIVAGTVTVVEPAPALSVEDAEVGAGTVAPNETVTATATVTNDGTASGTEQVALTVDGSVVGTASVTVAPGDSETVSISHSFTSEGTYALAVGGVSAGTVEVVGSSGNATMSAG